MTTNSTRVLAETRLYLSDRQEVVLQIDEWNYHASMNMMQVRYRIKNLSKNKSLMVFDRGVYGDWAGNIYAPGPVGRPTVRMDGDDMVLIHSSSTSTSGDLNSMPLAVEVDANAELGGHFIHGPLERAPQRLRWCVAVMPYKESLFKSPHKSSQGAIWIAETSVVSEEQMLCTPWYSIAATKFES